MSKFLTPPVWYDKNGNLNEMLTGNTETSYDIAIGSSTTATGRGIAIDGSASSGGIAIRGSASNGGTAIRGSASRGGIAIGNGASANEENGIAIGNSATLSESGNIAIGYYATAGALGCIAIGDGADASTPNTIQLGNNDTAYTLKIGNNTIDPALVQDFFAGNMVGGVSGNLYVYSNVYKSGEAGSPQTGWYRAEIDSVKQTVVVRDGNGKIKAADPTAANEVATKQYVDKEIANAIAALKL